MFHYVYIVCCECITYFAISVHLYFHRVSKNIRVKLTEHRTNIGTRIQHYVVVALTLLDCLPTVGSVDSNGLSCSTANGFVAIYYSCTVCIDLLLVGIPFHLLGLHPIAVFCELYKSLVLAMVEDLDLHTVAGESSTYVCIWCKCSAGE